MTDEFNNGTSIYPEENIPEKEVNKNETLNDIISGGTTAEATDTEPSAESESIFGVDETSDSSGLPEKEEVICESAPICEAALETEIESTPEAVSEPSSAYDDTPEAVIEKATEEVSAEHTLKEKNTERAAGIRYDADKNVGNGSYTWNYSNASGNAKGEYKKQKSGHKGFIAATVCFAVIATAIVSSLVTTSYVRNSFIAETAPSKTEEKPIITQPGGFSGGTENIVNVPSAATGAALTKQQIATKCKPSSVGIQTVIVTQGFYGYTYKTGGVGSGFILTADGYIATNHHVIENANTITVQLDDGTKHEATLVGSDSVTDLAVLKIDATNLVPMEIGDSDKMVVGDSVIAIGTPAGIEFAGTVTDGIISAINRGIEVKNDRGTVVKTMTLMQTNAAINPGNSGGPLINDRGEVIGINTMKLNSTYEGIGFSIPINSAVTIFNQLIANGKVSDYDSSFVTGNGAIGITNYIEIGKAESEYYNMPEGIVILQLTIDGNAYKAGLKRYDTIIGFQGEKVTTVAELNELKASYKAGDTVTLRVYREGVGEMDITFKLDLMVG